MATWMNLSFIEVAVDLDMHTNVLSRGVENRSRRPEAFRGRGSLRDDEVARLKRKLAHVKREQDF